MKLRRQEAVAAGLVVLGSAGIVAAALFFGTMRPPPDTVDLVARAPERGNWLPQTIHVRKGHEITLHIRNTDIVTHGFYLPEYDLEVAEIKAGERKTLTFTADRAGEFTFFCSVWCSDYHMHMRGTLIVE